MNMNNYLNGYQLIMNIKFFIFVFFLAITASIRSESLENSPSELSTPPTPPTPSTPPAKTEEKEISVTEHTVQINGQPIEYKAYTGKLPLLNDKGMPKAFIFFVAYIKKQAPDAPARPLTFCFNGGPGAAAVWLHMGLLGPKRVVLDSDRFTPPPYSYTDNEYSLLDVTDLVFVDPVSTGYSHTAPGEDSKQFHGVEEDIKSMGEFIQSFTTRYERWDSPKYIIGESYGTTRAAGLALHLLNEYKYYLNGIVLISSVLNFQTLDFDEGNDLAYLLYLPSYTAAAWYHKKLAPAYQKDLRKTLQDVETFALNEYAVALLQGDSLGETKRKDTIEKLSAYTGLPSSFIERADMRVDMSRFANELLRSENRILGRFDSRYLGLPDNPGVIPEAMTLP